MPVRMTELCLLENGEDSSRNSNGVELNALHS